MRCLSITARSTGLLLLLSPLLAAAQGQQGSGSPYSAYGLGDLIGSTQVAQATMGGLGVAVMDPASVIATNPASYVSLQRTCFETAVVVRSSKYATTDAERNGRRTDLLGLSLGVPFGKGRWGMALGVNPMSNVGYRISDTGALPNDGGTVTYNYTGDGGLNKAYMGAGLIVAQKRDTLNNGYRLSIGANVGYVFGTIEETRKAVYPISASYYNTSVVSSLVVRNPVFNAGVQLQGDLRRRSDREAKGLRYLAGVAVDIPSDLTARRTDLITNYGVSGTGVEIPFDTVLYVDGRKGTLSLPLGLGLGFTVYNLNWSVSAEVKQRDWRDLTVKVEGYDLPTTLASNTTYIIGASFRPAKEMGGSFWERSIYRAGFRYNNDYLIVGGEQLHEMAFSTGVSFPIMGSSTRSRLNIGTELGERGTTDNGLIRERFASIFVGITITPDAREPWFKKRRIE
ncbi:MAG: hypothetical protein JNL43_15595 [Flavobacteriales bacterium]|nr:hypothetical protein [Flavobacteriales bacterium]